jgi:iron complex transport system substrate-binding protein
VSATLVRRRVVTLLAVTGLAAVGHGCDSPPVATRAARAPRRDAGGPGGDRHRARRGEHVAPPRVGPVEATDDRGRVVRLAHPARRVVSLIPSGTETLVAVGAAGQLVGRTRYDTLAAVRHLPSVGGGLDPSTEALLALRPDLLVTWASDRASRTVARLEAEGVPTFAISTRDTTDVFRNAERLGTLTGHDSSGRALAAGLRAELSTLAARAARAPVGGSAGAPAVFFVVWPNPPRTAGPDTFITQVVGVAGGRPAFPDLAQDWPQVSMEEVVRRQPDVVLLPVGESRASAAAQIAASPAWRGLRAVREGRIALVEADLANRAGPNVARAARAIHDSLRAVLLRHPITPERR